MPGITKGFKLTGGPTSNAGQMADSGTINDTYAALRAKSSSINKIPGAQMILDAKKYAAEEDAETMRTKAEWDSKGLAAKYDYYADAAADKGKSAQQQGFVAGGLGLGMSAFNLFSGKKGDDEQSGDGYGTNMLSSFNGSNWDEMTGFMSDLDIKYTDYFGSNNPLG